MADLVEIYDIVAGAKVEGIPCTKPDDHGHMVIAGVDVQLSSLEGYHGELDEIELDYLDLETKLMS